MNDRFDFEFRRLDFHLTGFDFRQIEDVVDHLRQQLSGLHDVRGVATLLVGHRIDVFEHFRKTDNAIERSPQFMTHIGEELTFHLVHLM